MPSLSPPYTWYVPCVRVFFPYIFSFFLFFFSSFIEAKCSKTKAWSFIQRTCCPVVVHFHNSLITRRYKTELSLHLFGSVGTNLYLFANARLFRRKELTGWSWFSRWFCYLASIHFPRKTSTNLFTFRTIRLLFKLVSRFGKRCFQNELRHFCLPDLKGIRGCGIGSSSEIVV